MYNLLRYDVYKSIGEPRIFPATKSFTGPGNMEINCIGLLKCCTVVHGTNYMLEFYKLPAESMFEN